jgi:hypothetical protein
VLNGGAALYVQVGVVPPSENRSIAIERSTPFASKANVPLVRSTAARELRA